MNGINLKDALSDLGIQVGVLIAGFAGGLVSLQNMKGLSRWQVIGVLFTSLAIAGYGTPLLVVELHIETDALKYGAGFLLGLCAMRIIPLIQETVPQLWSWLIKKFTGASVSSGGGEPQK